MAHWHIYASNATGTFYIGIYSGEKQEAIQEASKYFVMQLRRERKSKEATFTWVYKATPWIAPEHAS